MLYSCIKSLGKDYHVSIIKKFYNLFYEAVVVEEVESVSSSEVEFEGSCHYREIENDMVRMFIVAMISAIVSAPLALSIQYLIMNVLSKESINQHDESQNKLDSHKTRMERLTTKRRINVSPVTSSPTELEESCGRDLQDDLNNILKELCNYYSEMMKNENKNTDNGDKKKNKITIKQIRGE